jgi:ERCC4-type nuclease
MIVLCDTREKKPWSFISYSQCDGQTTCKLDTGDYAISGDTYLITIDRKQSVSELSNNLIRSDRFKRELERMQEYKYRYVLCEFSYEKLLMFPKGSKLPKRVLRRIRINGKYLAKLVGELSDQYGVEFIFCENRFEAQDKAMELLTVAYNEKQSA